MPIQTGIELQDHFSGVLYDIMGAVNLAISSMYDMQQVMCADVDMSSMDDARDSINQATMALDELNAAMVSTSSSIAPPIINPTEASVSPISNPVEPLPPVNTPIEWQTDNLRVFTDTGIDRFQQEIQSANAMLEQLSSTQDSIARQAYNTDIFSPEAFQNLNSLAVRIDTVRERIQQIENNPVNLGTDIANSEMERLRTQLDQAVQEQNDLNIAMRNMDVSAANDAYLRLSNTVGNTERYIRDNVDEQGRFNQQIRDGTVQADNLMSSIRSMVAAYVSIQALGNVLNLSDELVQTNARLDMVAKNLEGSDELLNMVYASAQNARGSLSDMADVVARFGNNARDAFSSSEEVVAFAELVQKQMTVAGASTTEASNAMLQLSQALGSGVLRGDELNSIFEQAPNLIQNIADYLGVPIGAIREMASEGELTTDIVKNAIFADADEINAKFNEMPMTWGQIWQSMQNTATMAFQPVLQRINQIAGSDAFQSFVSTACEWLAVLANVALEVFDFMASCGQFVADNWSIISPILYGIVAALAVYGAYLAITKGIEMAAAAADAIHSVLMSAKIGIMAALTGTTMAATAAQMGYNGALYACPIVWIIIMLIALIAIFYAAVAAVNHFAGTSVSATGIICGALAVAGAFVVNQLVAVINFVIDIFCVLWNFIALFANFFANVFNDPVGAIARLFFDLADCILGILESLASAIDTIFGSNLAGAVSGWRDSLGGWVDETFGQGEEIMANMNGSDYHLDRINYDDAWNTGYDFGQGIEDTISDFSLSDLFNTDGLPNPEDHAPSGDYGGDVSGGVTDGLNNSGAAGNLDNIAGNTGDIADSLSITQEDLKYLRDLAEQETVNRFTIAEISIDQSGMKNTINGTNDLDGFVSGLTNAVNEAVDMMTEGVHD